MTTTTEPSSADDQVLRLRVTQLACYIAGLLEEGQADLPEDLQELQRAIGRVKGPDYQTDPLAIPEWHGFYLVEVLGPICFANSMEDLAELYTSGRFSMSLTETPARPVTSETADQLREEHRLNH